MSNNTEYIRKYTKGEMTAEEVNAKLDGIKIVPGKNEITETELKAVEVGSMSTEANGYGLLDTGTGTLDKVKVTNGKLSHAVNTMSNGVPNEYDLVYIGGQTWQVFGDELGKVVSKGAPWWASLHTFAGAVAWQDELDKYIPEYDMVYNRPKYHNQEVVKGAIRYKYAADGTCKYQPKSMFDYDKDHGRA